MNLPNLVRRVIIRLLTRCSVCHNPKHLHGEQDQGPRIQAVRVDSEVEGLAYFPSFPRFASLRAGREAEGDASPLAAQRYRFHSWLLGGNIGSGIPGCA
jgi:hypothetical protein